MLFSSVTVALIIPSGTALVLWDYFIDANGLMFIPLSVNLCKQNAFSNVSKKNQEINYHFDRVHFYWVFS